VSQNTDRLRLLVAALRSGEFVQTQSQLGRVDPAGVEPDKFCCLGVACEVAIRNGLDLDREVSSNDPTVLRYDGISDELPARVQEWYGIDGSNPVLVEENIVNDEVTCIEANDDEGLNFAEIADLMESRWEL